jgi:nitrogen fixation/metabolism regulation signal transduction histidine kinase
MPGVFLPLRVLAQKVRPAIVQLALLPGTIRGRILFAFLIMSILTAALGGYASLGIKRAGVLVAKTFDESLMSINYARAAAADFSEMQAAFARRWSASDPAMKSKLDDEIASLEDTLSEDLSIAAERSQSTRAAHAATKVQLAVDAWSDARRRLPAGTPPNTAWEMLDPYATTVSQQIDLLINYTAGDGFTYRQSARQAVTVATHLDLAATGGALLVSALVAWLLAQRITGPVAVASGIAKRIADGKLDGAIPRGALDELGALLAAMAVMRDNIRTMMEREVAQRRTAQVRLADALESSREGIVVIDADRQIALANSQAAEFFGSTPQQMAAGDLRASGSPDLAKSVLSFDRSSPATFEMHLDDGRWLRVSRSATQDGGFIAFYSDISMLKNQEEQLTGTNLLLDAALDNMCQGLCLYDH